MENFLNIELTLRLFELDFVWTALAAAVVLGVLAGILGPLTVVLLTVIGGANFPGYSHASDFISELGSTDASHGRLVSWAGFFPAGVFTSAFALLAWRTLPRSAAGTLGFFGLLFFAAGYLAAAFFPCEGDCRSAHPGFSQAMHNFFGLAGYLTAGGFFVGLRMGGRCDGALRTSFSVAGLPIRGRGAANPGSERARLDGGLRSLSSARALPSRRAGRVGKAARRR